MDNKRQERLDEVLTALREIEGLRLVKSDDFNSTAIDIFLTLQTKFGDNFKHSYGGSNTCEWAVPIRTVKANIRRACRKLGVAFNWLDWPVMQYYSSGGEKFKAGYDQNDFKIEVFIAETYVPKSKPQGAVQLTLQVLP